MMTKKSFYDIFVEDLPLAEEVFQAGPETETARSGKSGGARRKF
jgi:hypothetical protein